VTLDDVKTVDGFAGLSHPEKIKLFMWWLHTYQGRERVKPREVQDCYENLSLAPTNVATAMDRLESQKHLVKNSQGYRLEMSIADGLTAKHGKRDATVLVDKLLTALPNRLGNLKERAYLEETLICFRHKAFRAAIVMAWNLTYDHLCEWILADQSRLASFNTQMQKTYAKRNYLPIVNRDSFEELKEFEVVQILASAGLVNGGIHTILKEKLDRRNKAAHATGITIFQNTAEEVIIDLIENVAVKLM
jgi:hypothetical protein